MNHIMADIREDILHRLTERELELVVAAVNERRKNDAAKKFNEVAVGDRVMFNGRTRPKYLVGKYGTIKTKGLTKVTVALENGGVGRFRGDITTPMNLVEKI